MVTLGRAGRGGAWDEMVTLGRAGSGGGGVKMVTQGRAGRGGERELNNQADRAPCRMK